MKTVIRKCGAAVYSGRASSWQEGQAGNGQNSRASSWQEGQAGNGQNSRASSQNSRAASSQNSRAASSQNGRAEDGATMLEFAIILPLFMFFIFAIVDFSAVVSQRVLFSRALAIAGRSVGLSGGSSAQECFEVALNTFREELARFRANDSSFQLLSASHIALSEVNPNVTATDSFAIRLEAQPNCILCSMFLTPFRSGTSDADGRIAYRLAALFPLTAASDCRNSGSRPEIYSYSAGHLFRCIDGACESLASPGDGVQQ